MYTQLPPAACAAPILAAGIHPMTSDADYVSPYLRRPLRPLEEVERARQARENRHPMRETEQKEDGAARRDQ